MTFACARVLRICALLAMPASAFAQSTRSPTIFSPSAQTGTVTVRAGIVLADYSVKPLPLLKIVARKADRPDSMTAQTDLDGRVMLTLPVGRYTIRAKATQPVNGRTYAWIMPVVVRPARTEALQLTNANATSSDSISTTTTVVAAAPAPTPRHVPPRPSPTPLPAAPVSKPAPQPAKPAVERPVTHAEHHPAPVAPRPAPMPVDSMKKNTLAASMKPIDPPPTSRQLAAMSRTNTSGLIFGLSLNGSALRADDLNSDTESGAGLAAQLGWGFTKNFALLVDASAARIESIGGNFNLAHLDVAGRWHFVSKSHGFVPFLEVGYSGRALAKNDVLVTDEDGTTYAGNLAVLGGGVSFGGGLEYFLSRKWALGGAFKWTAGEFTQMRIDDVTIDGFGIDATSARFNMGFTWYPMGGR
jgi:hypothetical protein